MNRDLRSADSARSERLVRDGENNARLTHVRQELLAPAGAIAGYADILREETARLGQPALMPDIDHIVASADALLSLVEDLLGAGARTARRQEEGLPDFQARLLHDLRNPLNVIKGYGEMLLEDAAGLGGVSLRQDLERLLTEAARLLSSLERIVEFTCYHTAPAGAETERTRGMGHGGRSVPHVAGTGRLSGSPAGNGQDPGRR
jgi:signal transduction histidine kinase